MFSAAAQQYDGVFVCGCPESRSVEAALYQTLTPVQVSYMIFLSFKMWKVERKHPVCDVLWQKHVTSTFSQKLMKKILDFSHLYSDRSSCRSSLFSSPVCCWTIYLSPGISCHQRYDSCHQVWWFRNQINESIRACLHSESNGFINKFKLSLVFNSRDLYSIFSSGRTLKKQSSLSKWPMRRWKTPWKLRSFRTAITCVRWDKDHCRSL